MQKSNQFLLCVNIAWFCNFHYCFALFNLTKYQRRIRIMQFLVLFDQLHVGIGVTIIACHQLFIIISASYPATFPIILKQLPLYHQLVQVLSVIIVHVQDLYFHHLQFLPLQMNIIMISKKKQCGENKSYTTITGVFI